MTPPDFITVVAGYPRSGTSMMMRILEAGGLEALKDDEFRPPSEHNPKGFYEFGPALRLGRGGIIAIVKRRSAQNAEAENPCLPPRSRGSTTAVIYCVSDLQRPRGKSRLSNSISSPLKAPTAIRATK